MQTEDTPKITRPRTIRWLKEVDIIAKDLAHAHRLDGGVSELLERLVRAEAKRKRGIAHLHPRELAPKEAK